MDTINELFTNAVRCFPERPALIEPTAAPSGSEGRMTTLTYAMLQRRVHEFARVLQMHNIQQGDRVLLWSTSQSSWMVAYLAALLVGAAVVPLDVHTPEDMLNRIARITEATALITTLEHYQQLSEPSLPLINITHRTTLSLASNHFPPVHGNDLAELVFTSGTTGQPKGVMVSHRNITSNALAALQVIQISSNDRLLSFLPLSHMFEATIEMALLSRGASIMYACSVNPHTLLRLLSSHDTTCMVLVPQILELFMKSLEREARQQGEERRFGQALQAASYLPFSWRHLLFRRIHKHFGKQFRFFISGGAPLSADLARRWEGMGFCVLQGYGATECAPIITATSVRDHPYGSVGKALPGQQVRIAEDGEILVKGPNVARGYWKDPGKTKEVFKNGWYATGDLGFLDAQGFLFLRGRKDNLIVLASGLKISPEEVEQVLLRNPTIKDAVIVGLPKDHQGPALHAVLLMDDPTPARAIMQQANQRLAPHQQVRSFTVWPEPDFPRTPSTQKIKRSVVLEKLLTLQRQKRANGLTIGSL